MPFNILYHPDVKKSDVPLIDKRNRARIQTAIEKRLALHPEVYGTPLRRTLKGYWKVRVGDYRVVYRISGKDIIILGIIHRKDVYKRVQKRTAEN